jgi:DNA polymerase III delta subunit
MYDLRRRHVPSNEQARALKVNPYFLDEYVNISCLYSESEIERAFGLIANADEQLKSTSTDPKQILHAMIVSLLSQQELALV